MKGFTVSLIVTLSAGLLLNGCATPARTAAPKTYEAEGQKLVFGGTYLPREKELTITVNSDPVLRGRFPPYTPTQNLNGTYKNLQISANCYFGSVLGSQGGKLGVVAGIVQSTQNRTADKCDITVNSKPAESLFF